MSKRLVTGLTAVIILILILVGWAFWRSGKKTMIHHSTKPVEVTVQALEMQTIPTTVSAYGSSILPNSVDLLAKIDGNIEAIHFKPGEQVKKGQALFSIHSNNIENQIKALKAKMLDDKNNYTRYAQLRKNFPGGAAETTVVDYRLKYEQSLENYKEALALAEVKAPADGTISDTLLADGSFVTSGEVLAHLANPNLVQVRYQLPSQYADQAKDGQRITFLPNGSKTSYSGTVSYVAPAMDAKTHLLTIRANLNNAEHLKANRFGQITQTLNPNNKELTIPQGIANTDPKGFFVYTIKNGKAEKIYFKPGRVTSNGYIIVNSGLKAGEWVITSNTSSLNEGETVEVKHS